MNGQQKIGTFHFFGHCEVMRHKSHDHHLHNTIYLLKIKACKSEKSVDAETNIFPFHTSSQMTDPVTLKIKGEK